MPAEETHGIVPAAAPAERTGRRGCSWAIPKAIAAATTGSKCPSKFSFSASCIVALIVHSLQCHQPGIKGGVMNENSHYLNGSRFCFWAGLQVLLGRCSCRSRHQESQRSGRRRECQPTRPHRRLAPVYQPDDRLHRGALAAVLMNIDVAKISISTIWYRCQRRRHRLHRGDHQQGHADELGGGCRRWEQRQGRSPCPWLYGANTASIRRLSGVRPCRQSSQLLRRRAP